VNEFKVTMPWPTKNLSPNARPHWATLSREKAQYRSSWRMLSFAAGAMGYGKMWPMHERRNVHFEFYPPNRRPRDDANIMASIKSGVDGMADALGVDDRFFRTSYELKEQIGGYIKVTITRTENES